jgi:hypothetical protein
MKKIDLFWLILANENAKNRTANTTAKAKTKEWSAAGCFIGPPSPFTLLVSRL